MLLFSQCLSCHKPYDSKFQNVIDILHTARPNEAQSGKNVT